jgi:EXPERA (EXPanded EBP superfamily)
MPNNNTMFTTSYSYAFIKGLNWIRLPTIIYATQSLTSVIPMMGEFIASDKLDTQARIKLIAIYSPYFIIPLSMVLFLALDEYPFTQKPRRKTSKQQ